MTTTTVTFTPSPVKPNVPLWLTGHQCPRVEYNPTSEYKLKKGEKTGWGVVCQFTSRSQKEMNAIYVGGLEDRHAEGYGEWHSEEEKMSYHGGWKDNLASGWGRYCDSWTENWPDGWVKFIPDDADSVLRYTYEGGFKDGYFHGYGELTFRDKSKFEGSWREGRRVGYGKFTKDNGTIIEFQLEGAEKPPKKAEPNKDKPKPEPQPQVIYVQQQPQPQLFQPVVYQQPPTPQPQPQIQVHQPHEHTANAGVQLQWGHGQGSPPQQQAQPTYYYQPVPQQGQPIEIPARIHTPQPIPVQYSFGPQPPRPLTPVAQPGREGSQGYLWAMPPGQSPGQGGTPGNPPYPTDVPQPTVQLGGSPQGSPPNTTVGPGYLAHM
jgi:hypothetical protein